MKRLTWTLGIVVVAGVATAFAQPPGGPGRGGPGVDGPGGRPPMPVIEVLDADHDRVISADELKNATAALLTLDKNHDGKLTENEFAPQGGAAGGRGQGGPGAGGRNAGGAGRRPQAGPGRAGDLKPADDPGKGPAGGQNAGPPPPPNFARMVEHAMEFDSDKDGKLSQDELKKFAKDFESHQQGPGGPGGPGEGRPNGPGIHGPNNERTRRPD